MLNTLPPIIKNYQPKMSLVPRLRNPALYTLLLTVLMLSKTKEVENHV